MILKSHSVGVLAMFLLGEEALVETRHWSQGEGIRFAVRLGDQLVELNGIETEVGTSIYVRLSSETAERLAGMFSKGRNEQLAYENVAFGKMRIEHLYAGTKPSIAFVVYGAGEPIGVSYSGGLPDFETGEALLRWRRLKLPECGALVLWKPRGTGVYVAISGFPN